MIIWDQEITSQSCVVGIQCMNWQIKQCPQLYGLLRQWRWGIRFVDCNNGIDLGLLLEAESKTIHVMTLHSMAKNKEVSEWPICWESNGFQLFWWWGCESNGLLGTCENSKCKLLHPKRGTSLNIVFDEYVHKKYGFVVSMHDNVTRQTDQLTTEKIAEFDWVVLPPPPSCISTSELSSV